jgi:pimeloyl-ACP methyl ester carboxylesterase
VPDPPPLATVRQWQKLSQRMPSDDCGTQLLAAAVEAERRGDQNCSGLYFQAALASGRCLSARAACGEADCIAGQVHQASVQGMLATRCTGLPFALGDGLFVTVNGQATRVGVSIHGFAWDVADFQQLIVVGSYQTESLSRVHYRAGVGVPVVLVRVQRTGSHVEERFLTERPAFSATAVLRVHPTTGVPSGPRDSQATLELYNPHEISAIEYGGRRAPLAADFSAPLAYRAVHESPRGFATAWFRDPTAARGDQGLFFLEPYQPGKIPIVLVHGLLSSPSTWTDLANDLRATPGFDDHFQIWAFRYATGESFLRTAADLRRALYEAVETVDPHGADASLSSIVLVGHSMGGIVSKLQVVESRDVLWRTVAARPLAQIVADEPTRRELAEVLFFEPHPNVRRVVFLAVPHGGSSFAARPVGRVASVLARPDPQRAELHARLIAANPGVFAPEFERRLPTSIDMLEPKNPILQAIRHLPLAEHVAAHSVIGTGGAFTLIEPGDGVVPAASAMHGQTQSAMFVRTNHERVHRDEQTVQHVREILMRHLAEFSPEMSGPTTASTR